MQWMSAISRADRASDAVEELVEQVWRQLDEAPDVVAVFASRHHANSAAEIPTALARAFDRATIAGCVAHSVVGGGEEEEQEPSVTVTAGRLPGARAHLHIVTDVHDLRSLNAHEPDDVRAVMVLADSFTADTDALLEGLDTKLPRATKFGGLASGGIYPGSNVLFAADRALRQGAVLVVFEGNVTVDTIVAQGCRPIGAPMRVAERRDNVVLRFADGRPRDVLEALYEQLSPEDRQHIPASLNIGIEMRSARSNDGLGEYLVRPIMGVDPNSGALSVSERVRDDDVVQFHLRDAASCSEDLRRRVGGYRSGGSLPCGAMLFTCIGRGERLYGTPNHDTGMFGELMGPIPIGGFFAAGEVGAVGDRTFLHGYTSTFALFRARDE